MTSLTHLVFQCRGGNWERLLRLITTPDGKHKSGGWQDRKKKWLDKANEANRSIELDQDDIEFIRNQIMNKNGGGWQKYFYDIFAGNHPSFTGLPITPRKKPGDRRHRPKPDDSPPPPSTPDAVFNETVQEIIQQMMDATSPPSPAHTAEEPDMAKVKQTAKQEAVLPERLKIRAVLADLKDAVCGSTTHCVLAHALKRMFPKATFVRVKANGVTVSLDGLLYHYNLPDPALKLVAWNDDGTLTYAQADRTVILKRVDVRRAYTDLSPDRKKQIRQSEANRKAAGTLREYERNTRLDAAKRAGKRLKKVMAVEAAHA